jgi:hypothetical protein
MTIVRSRDGSSRRRVRAVVSLDCRNSSQPKLDELRCERTLSNIRDNCNLEMRLRVQITIACSMYRCCCSALRVCNRRTRARAADGGSVARARQVARAFAHTRAADPPSGVCNCRTRARAADGGSVARARQVVRRFAHPRGRSSAADGGGRPSYTRPRRQGREHTTRGRARHPNRAKVQREPPAALQPVAAAATHLSNKVPEIEGCGRDWGIRTRRDSRRFCAVPRSSRAAR